jgi:hypothetical protein
LKRVDLTQRFRLLGVRVSKLQTQDDEENMPQAKQNRAQAAIKSGAYKDLTHPDLF